VAVWLLKFLSLSLIKKTPEFCSKNSSSAKQFAIDNRAYGTLAQIAIKSLGA
jgi:hypothetical protein